VGNYRAACELGLDIPGDLSVGSVDNWALLAKGFYTGLTTLAHARYEMGAWACATSAPSCSEQATTLVPVSGPSRPVRSSNALDRRTTSSHGRSGDL